MEPAADPLPAQVQKFLDFENSIKTPTNKKYEANPIELITSSS